MGNAVPVVATDILGHGEYLDGSGILVPPSSPEELAAAIHKVWTDAALREQLGRHGRERAEAELGWDDVAAQTLDVFRRVLEGEPAPVA